MNINIIASTNEQHIATRQELEHLGGIAAGVCYMPNNFESLINEPFERTEKRINRTKTSKHHSVYEHGSITLQLENIPKGLAMVLNNEGQYVTSEKSARYTKMILKKDEQELYDKWLNIFKEKITQEYAEKYPNYFNESKIEKLAQENARYLISVFTPTSMLYTVPYGQLNKIYAFMKQEINRENQNEFYKQLIPSMEEFCEYLEKQDLVDKDLSANEKKRSFSLMSTNVEKIQEYFGDVYATKYKGSFAQLAQAQRHRTLKYSFNLDNENTFFVPPIIASDEKLVEMWKEDCESRAHVFPQGLLLNISEMGTMDYFV